jgi:protein-L-isoaspartate(D-aspartate) O-methyltransferase
VGVGKKGGSNVSEQDFEAMRRAMVASQLRTNAVDDQTVLAQMGSVPRERFVPAAFHAVAYVDKGVALGHGRELNPPLSTARLLSELHPRASDRALVVGAATGYSAALLAGMVAHVTALEEQPDLARQAADALAPYPNVALVQGALAEGWAAGAPYDLVLIDGAVETIPTAIQQQLVDGGRLAAGLIGDGVIRMVIGSRAGQGFGTFAVADYDAAPLPGFAPAPAFQF